jgi:glycosyltransferase involved in cell wall biosynthesis
LQGEKWKSSVIILTKNSANTIRKCLDSVFEQTVKPDEIIVVDGSSKDETLEIVKNYPVKIVTEPGLGYGYARNLGIKNSVGDIIFFIDSDCYAEPQWIEKILPHFDNAEIAGVTGRLQLWNTEHGVARFLAYVGHRLDMPLQGKIVKIAPTMNLAIRRDIILKVGGFDSTLVRCEDTDITYKISKQHKIFYEPQAVVWFRGSPTLSVASKKCIKHFIGVGQLFAKHGFKKDFVRLNLLLRGLILIAALISFFLAFWHILVMLLGFLLIEFFYKTVKMYRRCKDRSVLYYFVFFTFWSLASIAIFYGGIIGLKNRRKES